MRLQTMHDLIWNAHKIKSVWNVCLAPTAYVHDIDMQLLKNINSTRFQLLLII